MQRFKNTGNPLPPRPGGFPGGFSGGFSGGSPGGAWLAGMMIGTTIMTMATQAMVLGAGAAIQDALLKRG